MGPDFSTFAASQSLTSGGNGCLEDGLLKSMALYLSEAPPQSPPPQAPPLKCPAISQPGGDNPHPTANLTLSAPLPSALCFLPPTTSA